MFALHKKEKKAILPAYFNSKETKNPKILCFHKICLFEGEKIFLSIQNKRKNTKSQGSEFFSRRNKLKQLQIFFQF